MTNLKHLGVTSVVAFFCLLWSALAKAQTQPALLPIGKQWHTTWATAQQTPVKSFMPYNNEMSHRSVRQIIKVSAGGDIIRLQLSNIFSSEPVVIRSVYVADVADSSRIIPSTARYLRFSGQEDVVIAPGKQVTSDAETFHLRPLQRLAITINYKTAPKVPTVHMGSRTTSYILKGSSTPRTSFDPAFKYEKWFNIASLDVYGTHVARSFAIIGNSITDGKGSTTDHQNRWPDRMSEELNRAFLLAPTLPGAAPKGENGRETALEKEKAEEASQPQYAVLNLGIGNNRVLTVGFGQPARQRFDRDILAQRGITDVIVMEGINDLGVSVDGPATAHALIEEYRVMARKAHERHLRAWICTLTPMLGAGYYSTGHEEGREMVNHWIRTQKDFDGVIDFDLLMRDPSEPKALRPEWRLTDCLHPNAEGYKMMGSHAAEVLMRPLLTAHNMRRD